MSTPSPIPTNLLVRGNPRDRLADDQRMDVVRALVRVDRLEVAHVPAALVLVGDAARAQDLPGGARDLERALHFVHLAQRDALRLDLLRFLEAPALQAE